MSKILNTIIVAGSGRSGTTWLGNVIAGDEFRIIFEPFDYRHVPEAEGLGLRPYFRPEGSYPQWYSFVDKVLTGDVRNAWTDQDHNRLRQPGGQKGVVVKEIRANGMLGWIKKNFHCRIVFLIRSPHSVIASRIKLGWETHIDQVLNQADLMEDHLSSYRAVIQAAKSRVQKHCVMWCIENLIPLKQMSPGDWVCCRYEDMVVNREEELPRLLKTLNLDYCEARRKAAAEIANRGNNEGRTGGIADYLTEQERQDVDHILELFNLGDYKYTFSDI